MYSITPQAWTTSSSQVMVAPSLALATSWLVTLAVKLAPLLSFASSAWLAAVFWADWKKLRASFGLLWSFSFQFSSVCRTGWQREGLFFFLWNRLCLIKQIKMFIFVVTSAKVMFCLCLLGGWFADRITQNPLIRFPWNLDGGRLSVQSKPH